MGFCEAWISGLGGEESHWVMRHWVGVESGGFGYVWGSDPGLGWVRWGEKWEVKKMGECVGVRRGGGFVQVGEKGVARFRKMGVIMLFVCFFV